MKKLLYILPLIVLSAFYKVDSADVAKNNNDTTLLSYNAEKVSINGEVINSTLTLEQVENILGESVLDPYDDNYRLFPEKGVYIGFLEKEGKLYPKKMHLTFDPVVAQLVGVKPFNGKINLFGKDMDIKINRGKFRDDYKKQISSESEWNIELEGGLTVNFKDSWPQGFIIQL